MEEPDSGAGAPAGGASRDTVAQIGAEGQWGKTGTTENNGDAWFCGGVADEVTACVWVGYPDTTTPMTTLYNGGPVMGGTFPALIWASVISAWQEIQSERAAERKSNEEARGSADGDEEGETETYVAPESAVEETAPEVEEEAAPETEVEPEPEVEAAPEEATPEATPEAAPESGGGGGVTAG